MNNYSKVINRFLSCVTSRMSSVYLPAFFVSLLELLEDYYRFNYTTGNSQISENHTSLKIKYPLSSAYFLSYLLRIRNQIPSIKMIPGNGKSHDERFLTEEITADCGPGLVLTLLRSDNQCGKIISDMKRSQNVYPVFEQLCPIISCHEDYITIDTAAVDTLLSNSILYTSMGEMLCHQYLKKISCNANITEQIDSYFLHKNGRSNFSQTEVDFVVNYQENRCFYCGSLLDYPGTPRPDHFIPLIFMKHPKIENLVISCSNCYSSKFDQLPGVPLFSKLLQRNVPSSDFWRLDPKEALYLDKRLENWVRNYYQASKQLITGWIPEKSA